MEQSPQNTAIEQDPAAHQALIVTLPNASNASFLIGTQVWGFNGC
jgi:hypothetical protein